MSLPTVQPATDAGGTAVAELSTGEILGRTPPSESAPIGVDLHPDTTLSDGQRTSRLPV
jgi:hypothetical protein